MAGSFQPTRLTRPDRPNRAFSDGLVLAHQKVPKVTKRSRGVAGFYWRPLPGMRIRPKGRAERQLHRAAAPIRRQERDEDDVPRVHAANRGACRPSFPSMPSVQTPPGARLPATQRVKNPADASVEALLSSPFAVLRSEKTKNSSRVESRQVVFRSAGFRCVRRFQLRGKEPPDRARLHLLPLFTPDVRISRIRRSRTRRRGHTQEAVSSIRRVVPACSVQGTGTSSFRWVGGRDVGCDV